MLCLGTFYRRPGLRTGALGHQLAAAAASATPAWRWASRCAQTYRFVLLPMSFRVIVPPLTSEFLNIFKNSAVASTIGLLELAAQGRQLVDYTARPYEIVHRGRR